jgi:hypothetical protein
MPDFSLRSDWEFSGSKWGRVGWAGATATAPCKNQSHLPLGLMDGSREEVGRKPVLNSVNSDQHQREGSMVEEAYSSEHLDAVSGYRNSSWLARRCIESCLVSASPVQEEILPNGPLRSAASQKPTVMDDYLRKSNREIKRTHSTRHEVIFSVHVRRSCSGVLPL